MSHIRGKDNGPEWAVRRLVHAMGFRYRLLVRGLPDRPDLVLPRHRKNIFVNGKPRGVRGRGQILRRAFLGILPCAA